MPVMEQPRDWVNASGTRPPDHFVVNKGQPAMTYADDVVLFEDFIVR